MFQTDINHFLQAFAFDGLTAFMQGITALGYLEFFMILLVFILFAVHFKKGFILLMVLLWTGGFTFFLKDYFDLPRPFHVDNTLELLDGQLPDSTHVRFEQQDAKSFFAPLPENVVAQTRQAEHLENGFPSGHTSVAVTLWGLMALLFRRLWLTAICVSLMVLIPLSRLYLGVHFLADVLGGYVLGFGLLFLFYKTILKEQWLQAYLKLPKLDQGWHNLIVFLLISPFLFFLLVSVEVWLLAAYAFGFGLGFYLLGRRGFPRHTGTRMHRLGCFVLAGVFLVLSKVMLKSIFIYLNLEMVVLTDFIRHLLEGVLMIWVAVELCIKLGWMTRNTAKLSA